MAKLLPRHCGLKRQDTFGSSFLCFRGSISDSLWHIEHPFESLCEACPVFICRCIDELVDVIPQIWDERCTGYILSAWIHSMFWIKLAWSFRLGMTRHRHVRLQMMQTDVSHSTRETSSSPKGGHVYKTISQLGLAECNTIIQELGFQESHWYCILMIGVFLKFRIIKNAYSNQPFTYE